MGTIDRVAQSHRYAFDLKANSIRILKFCEEDFHALKPRA